MGFRQKGLQDYLHDDPSLAEKITYEEFCKRTNGVLADEDAAVEHALNEFVESYRQLEKSV